MGNSEDPFWSAMFAQTCLYENHTSFPENLTHWLKITITKCIGQMAILSVLVLFVADIWELGITWKTLRVAHIVYTPQSELLAGCGYEVSLPRSCQLKPP